MPANKFHYIWMGSVLPKYEDAFRNGPNDLARQLRELINHSNLESTSSPQSNPQDQEIIMWVPEDIIDDIKERNLLDPLITLKPIEDIYKNSKHLSRSELDKLRKSVDVLGEHKAYSAQKDVVSAAILEEYGGYYFDTTTQIESVSSLMDNSQKELWFPTIMSNGKHYDDTDYSYHGEINYTSNYTEGSRKLTISGEVYLPDVWALHSSRPGQGFFKNMMNSYTQKCQYFFPEKFNNQHLSKSSYMVTLDGQSIPKSGYMLGVEGGGAQLMQDERRDTLIGQLVIFSLLDAVCQSYGPPTDSNMEQISFPALDLDDYRHVESMGIKKFHNGIWRTPEVVTRMDDNISTAPISEPVAQNKLQAIEGQTRTHMLPVNSANFKDIKLKYKEMKGDALKREIISDFRNQIAEIDSLEGLDLFVKDFKQSVAYDVLKTGQGLVTRLGARVTGSVREIDSIVSEIEAKLKQDETSFSMRNK